MDETIILPSGVKEIGGFNDYVGQEEIKNSLKIAISSAQKLGQNLPNIMLHGSAGLGKTQMADVIAKEAGRKLCTVIGGTIGKSDEMFGIIYAALKEKRITNIIPIVYIDEIHRLPKKVEEFLYPVLQDNIVQITSDDGYLTKRIESVPLGEISFIGATTLLGDLSRPLRDRFRCSFQLQPYSVVEMIKIVKIHFSLNKFACTAEAIESIARRARSTGRVAVNLVKDCIDDAVVSNQDIVTTKVVESTFARLGIDEDGLTRGDVIVLKALSKTRRPVGIDCLSAATGIETITITETIEPFLLQQELISRTPRGRVVTFKGMEKAGVNPFAE